MAISFSRPDPSSPAAVADATFQTSRRGFDQHEVREFLRVVGAELARAQERERFLEQELRTRRQQPQVPVLPAELDDETVARLLGEETTRIVQAARESAAAIRSRAEETAERLVRDAREEAQRLREDSELDASRRRKDAETDAEAELEMAKQQGREMVEEARAYRERALGELSRRRDLARQQIDQLVHARDRLVQAFERARLAAADVVAELVPLGELDEYVNLAPTTGPVPVMVPASKLAERSSISDDTLAFSRPRDEPPAAPPRQAPVTDAAASTGAAGTPGEAAGADTPDVEATTTATPTPAEAPAENLDADADVTFADDVEPGDTPDAPVVGELDDTAEIAAPSTDGPSTDVSSTDVPSADVTVGRNATVLQFPKAPSVDVPDDMPEHVDESAGDPDATAEAPGETSSEPEATPAADDDVVDDDDITASDVDDLFARLRATQDEHAVRPGAADPVDDAASPFERRDEALTPLIVACGRKLKRVLADEQNAALDLLRRMEPVTSVDQVVGGEGDHGARYVDAVAAELLSAARAGAESVGRTADDDRLREDALSPVGATLTADLVRPLRDRLAQRIVDSDGDNEAVTKSARAVYREWKTKHIDECLDDLLRSAYNRGAYVSLPAGTLCRWVADPGVGACSECEDNTLQGPVPVGTSYPTGHLTAPAHAGCRCLIQPTDH